MKSIATLHCRLSLAFATFIICSIGAPLAQSQTYRVVYTFAGGADGIAPQGGLVTDGKGNLYGTTSSGGVFPGCRWQYGCGTVFVLSLSGDEKVLHRFNGSSGGGHPFAGLLLDSDGNLYGTTSSATGLSYGGNVFKTDPTTGRTTVVYGFSDGKDGGFVLSGLIEDSRESLYGTTAGGGNRAAPFCQANGCGVVFKINKNGKEKVIHTFTGPPDGWWPRAGLVRDAEGNLYGTTEAGGASSCNCGTAFKIDRNGKETVLHSFAGYPDDGEGPNAGVIRDEEGNLYGTTISGGSSIDFGMVYRLDAKGKLTVLHAFAGPDGANPIASLVRDSAGNLYGTTYLGGDPSCDSQEYGCGVVFRLDPAGNYSLLHTFSGLSDGWYPQGSLLLDAAGRLYGAAGGGIQSQGVGSGVVFEITP
jgi:uncharacterized repeat protein (TIGR03803 family)